MMSDLRTPNTPPSIDPLPVDVERPFWSVMIPSYNCISYLRLTLHSVIQAHINENVQIEVVDDCSTDGDVEALVNEIGKGKIHFYRQERNVGSLRNFETCIKRAQGHWIHLLHGDDLIRPRFYTEIKKLIDDNPTIGAAFCRTAYINEEGKELFLSDEIQSSSGIISNWLLKIAQRQQVEPPTIVVKRSVYETLGSFYGMHYGEDWVMWVRIASQFSVAYTPKVLALYRDRSNNVSANSILSGQNVKDIRRAIKIINPYIPKESASRLLNNARRNFACFFAGKAYSYFNYKHYRKSAMRQAIGAFQLHANKTTLKCMTRLLFRYTISLLSLKKYKFKN